jgi:hypothetical protein
MTVMPMTVTARRLCQRVNLIDTYSGAILTDGCTSALDLRGITLNRAVDSQTELQVAPFRVGTSIAHLCRVTTWQTAT